MAEAAKAFVVLDELNAAVGEKIAAVTGAEAGYVTCRLGGGDAARGGGLHHRHGDARASAACRTRRACRTRSSFTARTASTTTRCSARRARNWWRSASRARTERWEYEAAFTERTAAVAFVDSPSIGPGALDFATVVEVAHAHDVPVIVDAASTLPPVSHLTRWIAGRRGPRHLQRRQGDSRPAGLRPARRAGGFDRRRAAEWQPERGHRAGGEGEQGGDGRPRRRARPLHGARPRRATSPTTARRRN